MRDALTKARTAVRKVLQEAGQPDEDVSRQLHDDRTWKDIMRRALGGMGRGDLQDLARGRLKGMTTVAQRLAWWTQVLAQAFPAPHTVAAAARQGVWL